MTKIYRKVYRDEVKALGADAAYFLAELRAFAEYCAHEGYIDENGYFELSAQKVEEMTGFGEHKQKYIFSDLVNRGILDRKFTATKRHIKILGDKMEPQGVQNGTPKGTKRNPSGDKMEPLRGQNGTPHIIIKQYDKNDKNSDKLYDEKNNINTFDLIRDYFTEKGQENEAAKFIKYNRENFGENHITPDNYKKLADKWIKAKRNPPKKKKASGRGRSAREVAEAQGLTVDELLKNSGKPQERETKPENLDPLITELFGG